MCKYAYHSGTVVYIYACVCVYVVPELCKCVYTDIYSEIKL